MELKWRNPLSRHLHKPVIVTEYKCYYQTQELKHPEYLSQIAMVWGPIFKNSFKTTTIALTDHAFKRWNERVGPIVDYKTLLLLLKQLMTLRYRIQRISDSVAILDEDIVFTYVIDGDVLCITTFYGRKSIFPALQDFETLRTYNMSNHELIDLTLSPSTLKKMPLPYIPRELIRFNGSKRSYTLEIYPGKTHLYALLISKEGGFVTRIINLQSSNYFNLDEEVLQILYSLGFESFVNQQLQLQC